MTIDLSRLTVEELDALIFNAAQERDRRQQPLPENPPSVAWTSQNPKVVCEGFGNGVMLKFRHAGYSWIHFMLDRQLGATLCGALVTTLLGTTASNAQPLIGIPGPLTPSGPTH